MTKYSDDEMIIGVSRPEVSIGSGTADPGLVAVEEGSLVLQLADLVPDGAGEVALDVADIPVNLLSDATFLDAGMVEAHVTASGVDVSGQRHYKFSNGITIYSPSSLQITLV